LGSCVRSRDAIGDAWAPACRGRTAAPAALDAAVARGNRLLRQFERASPDR
ncbi:MAG: sn-glycerol-3-phosphate ABC transporter substrate-binding protein, partial [Bradyrhizobium sp.]